MTTNTERGVTPTEKWSRSASPDSQAALLQRDNRRMPGRPRSRGLITLAVLLMIGCGLAVALLVSRAGDKVTVLAIGKPVAKGEVVERGDLVTLSVAGVPGAVEATELDKVVGKTAATDLTAQQVVTEQMVTSDPVPGEGEALVGLSVDPARAPAAGLAAGDSVKLVAVGDPKQTSDDDGLDSPEVLAEAAEVYSVEASAGADGSTLLTVIVPSEKAARIAAYSTGGRVAVVETAAAAGETGE